MASTIFAQVFTANLTGLVTDPNQAAIPAATVKIQNVGTGETRQTSSGQDGRYTFSQLLPGAYEVTVEAKGFKTTSKKGITLVSNQSGELSFAMQVGDVSQTIEVSENVLAVDTQTANQALTLGSKAIQELPLNTRNPFAFVHSMAGVTAPRTGIQTSVIDSGWGSFAFNGARDNSSAILVDGLSPTTADWGALMNGPGTDAVVEVQVVRNSYDLQYGKSGGGVVNIVTKSGTQSFHGTIFDYLRNDHLDANAWAQNRVGQKKVTFGRNQFGANIGGPIWKSKKLYFFFAYEGNREGIPVTYTDTVPTLLQRQGNFSQTLNANGTLATIYNPFTTRANPAGAGSIRDPFPGNIIPSNLFDPVATATLGLIPAPNQPGNPVTGALNYFIGDKSIATQNRYDLRFDWARTEKHQAFARFGDRRFEQRNANYFRNFADNNIGRGLQVGNNFAIGNTFIPNPTLVINVLAGWAHLYGPQIYPGSGIDGTKIGLPANQVSQLDVVSFPRFTLDGYAPVGSGRTSYPSYDTYNLQLNVTKQRNAHSIKFGFAAESGKMGYGASGTSLNLAFNRGMTSGPTAAANSTVTGNSIASLLLGTGASGAAPIVTHNASNQMYYGLYVQDSWKISPRITLNFGLRYELQKGRTERYNRYSNFDYSAISPLAARVGLPLRGGLDFRSDSSRGLWQTDKTDFAPRIGIAAKITSKLVARAGYGIYYPQTTGALAGPNIASGGFSTQTDWITSRGGDGITPQDLLRSPFPNGITQPVGSSQGLATLAGQAIDAYQRYHPTGYVQNYSFDLQYEIGRSSMIEVGYSGNQSRKLMYGVARNANQLPSQYLSLGSALDQQVRNPFQGVILTGPLAGATIPYNQLLRAFPQFTAVNNSVDTPGASASFNALVAKVAKQFSGGLMLVSSYQWSKALDDASETQGWEIADNFRDYYNHKLERSISGHDVPHSWVTSMVYELPVGKGRKFGTGLAPVADAVLGGWQISTTTRFSNGLPLQFTSANNLSAYGFTVQRPNIANLKDAEVPNQLPERWFNTSAFSAPANYTIGSAPRYFPNIRFGPQKHADVALAKTFKFKERVTAKFLAEALNLSNTPQFGRANTVVGNPAFGSATTTINRSRNIQLSLRLQF